MLTVRLKEPARVMVRMKEILQVFDPSVPAFEKGYEAGKKAQYDAFWDAYLTGFPRYTALFAGGGWDRETFKPARSINFKSNCSYCFYYNCAEVDLVALCEELGITMTFKPENAAYMFAYSLFTHLPEIDFTNVTALSNAFVNCKNIVTMDKLILKSNGTNTFASTFSGCNALENVVIEGVIGNNVSFQNSHKLSRESIVSILNALSPSTSGLTVTLSKTAKESAFTADEWAALIAEKPNWTIALS